MIDHQGGPDEPVAEVIEPEAPEPRRWPWMVGGVLLLAGLWIASRRRTRGKP